MDPTPSSMEGPRSAASWFGDLDAGDATAMPAADPLDTRSAEAAPPPGTTPDTEPKASPRAQAMAQNRPTFHRIYRAFLSARLAVGLLALTLIAGAWGMGTRPPLWMPVLAVGYLALAGIVWAWPSQRRPEAAAKGSLGTRQALSTVGVDLAAFAVLHYLTGTSLNTQALMVLPVLMAAVLMPRLMAMGVAATATLNLLSAAWIQSGEGAGITALVTQAGLNGFGLFVIAALASELSARLAREERSARGSLELARQQAQLNRLVIEEMSEGVLVVDRQGHVRTANPSARRLLSAHGSSPVPPFVIKGVPAWQPLIRAVERALGHPDRAEDGQEVHLRFDDHSQRDLRLRVRFTRGGGGRTTEDLCVMFLEDLRSVRARQRQDKLAAMGRMSAGIAHEVRNPLAAIAQANALLAEDANNPTQRRLTQMVTDNVARLKHIVDDILVVAPGARPLAPAISPIEAVVAICNEWRSTAGLSSGKDGLLDVITQGCQGAPGYPHVKVRFEPEHLQRVLVNLLDNALRYNSGAPGAMIVNLRWVPQSPGEGVLMLSVCNDGEPISPDTERALFEPFFSTRSRGTGLGLYISRELCERHGASIDYRLHPPSVRHRNEFFLTMPIEAPDASPTAA
jgi:two-component system sensor histidine kinase PilS (NtrC family)